MTQPRAIVAGFMVLLTAIGLNAYVNYSQDQDLDDITSNARELAKEAKRIATGNRRFLQGKQGLPGVLGRSGKSGGVGPTGPAGKGARGPVGVAGLSVVGPGGPSGVGLPGPQGLTGLPGISPPAPRDGKDGSSGRDGKDGSPGANGSAGAPGAQGPGPTDAQVQAAVDAYCQSHNNCAPPIVPPGP